MTMGCLAHALEVEVEEEEDDGKRRGNDQLHLFLRALHVLVLPADRQRRQSERAR